MSTAIDPFRPVSGSEHAPPSRSTPLADRALAPDLARGMMLLLIALAHVPWFLFNSDIGSTLLHPVDGNLADRIAQAFTIIVVDARTHTMFAFLFAYGIGQLYTRQTARDASTRDARRLLRTRHLWLFGFGLVHATVLWQGDILATYGLMGLLFVPLFLRRSDRTLKVWIGILLGIGAVLAVASTLLVPSGTDVPNQAGAAAQMAITQENYLDSILPRLTLWGPGLVSALISLVLPAAFLLGLLASRHRVLDEPARYLRLLRWTASIGITVGWSVGLAQALAHIGVVEMFSPAALSTAHFYTGFFAGIGYAALFGLIAHRIVRRGTPPRLPARALLALGRRSLSGYLAQSVIFVPVLSAWGLGLGGRLTSWSAMAVGIGTWLLTVLVAYLLDRAGIRGPAEKALRKLTYRAKRRGREKAESTSE